MAEQSAQGDYSQGYRRWLLAVLLLAYTLNFVDRSIVAVLAQPIKLALHLTDAQLGVLSGLAFAAFYTVVGLPMARLADRLNRVWIMGLSVAAWSIMTALGGVARNYAQLALARMGVGVGEAGFLPTAHSLISEHFPPERRATALAVFGMGIPLGSMLGAFSGGWIAQHLDWRIAFFVAGAPGLLASLLILATFKEPPRGLSDAAAPAGEAPSALAVLRRLAAAPGVLWAVAGATLASTAGYGVANFLGPLLVRHYLPPKDYFLAGIIGGLIVGAPTLLSALGGGVLSDQLAKRDRRAYALVPAATLLAACPIVIYALTRPAWPAFLAFMLVAGLGQQAYLAPTFALVNNAVDARMRATAIAFVSLCLNLVGLGLGPPMTGALSDAFAGLLAKGAGADVFGLCGPGACNASATGLQYAMIVMAGFYGLAGLAYLLAARGLRRV